MPAATRIQFWQIAPILKSVEDQVDVDSLLRETGLSSSLARMAPEAELPLQTYFRIQREIARSLNDLTLHLSSRKLIYQTGDFVLEQMKRARTLREAVECLCEYFNMMHGDTYNATQHRGDVLALIVDDTNFPYTLKQDEVFTRFVGDCVLIKVHCLLDSLTHGVATKALQRVAVRRSRTEPGGDQNTFWSVPITYGRPVYELIYDFDLACQPIQAPNNVDLSTDGIFARVIGHIETLEQSRDGRSIVARVRELIEDGHIYQENVAARLEISVATLRRRLSDEDTSFRALLHKIRFEEAKAMLERGRSVNQVSEQLDYSDIRAFNRAFKKWAGQTPAAFAKTIRPSER
ncbi:MAG: helix-turn-helix domain-containing protein [Pseudomonadota bacterium]